MEKISLHATPYGVYDDYAGFYFSSLKDYDRKSASAVTLHGCEEHEIQFIDGPDRDLHIFEAMRVSQWNLAKYFHTCEKLRDAPSSKVAAFLYLLSNYLVKDADEALEKHEQVSLFEGTAVDYARELIEDGYSSSAVPDVFKRYFNYEAYARDLDFESSIDETSYDGKKYVVANPGDL